MPRVLIHAPAQLPRAVFLPEGIARLGRGPDQDLRIDDPSVAMSHGELVILQEKVFIRDLSSGEAIWLDGKRVIGSTRIRDGQILRLGKVELRVAAESSDSEPATAVTRQSPSVSAGLLLPNPSGSPGSPNNTPRGRKEPPVVPSRVRRRWTVLFVVLVISTLLIKLIANRLGNSP